MRKVFGGLVKLNLLIQSHRVLLIILVAIMGVGMLASVPIFSKSILRTVFAGTMTEADLRISDSRAEQTGVSYNFEFRVAETDPVARIRLTFCNSTSSCTLPANLPTGLDTTGATLAGQTAPGSGFSINTTTNGQVNFIIGTTAASDLATTYGIALSNVTNPNGPASFYVRIESFRDTGYSDLIDSVWVASAVLTDTSITMTADIGPAFTFTVAGVDPGNDNSGIGLTAGYVNGRQVNTVSTANLVSFGTLTSGSENMRVAAHDVTIISNALNGFLVTVRHDGGAAPLNDGTNNIDSFPEPNSNPTVWASPSGGTPNVNTGFLGYTTEDFTLATGTQNRFQSNRWAGTDGTTPYEVIYYNTATSATGVRTRVGWAIDIHPLQPSGNYTGTMILVATPTY